MRERRQIVQLWHQGEASALITLVHAEGSSYRQPGARLLLRNGGEYAGTISGGCLEAELLRKAAWLVRNGAVVERYSTALEDSAEIPFGLGCGGVINLLLEPADTPEYCALLSALESTLAGDHRTVLTWLPENNRRLARAVFDAGGSPRFLSEGLDESAARYARTCAAHGINPLPEEIFVEQLTPPQRLFVLGAGDDAKPLVNMAAILGWNVTVMDGRAQLARAERFPAADHVAVISEASAATRKIQPSDAIVLMTHSYEQDRELLAALLPLRPKYLGLLGARQRSSLLIAETAAKLDYAIEDCCAQVCAPIGLDLGGEGPDAIALAVIAEIQACCMGKSMNSTRLSPQDVERYVAEGGASRYLHAQCALDAR